MAKRFSLNQRKKVLHIATALSWRGGEQQLAYLVQELKDEVDQIVLCSLGSELAKFCNENGVDFVTQKKRGGFDLAYGAKIKRMCKKLEIDLCHMHDAHAHTSAIIAAVLGNKTPLVLSRRVDFPIKKKWTSKFKYNHPAIKKILCVSEMIKKILSSDIQDKGKLHKVYSGIDLAKFKDRNGQLRKELGISEDTPLVGNTSALADHKDYFTFLESCKKILEKSPKVKFVVMGDGPMKNEIHQYAEKLGLSQEVDFSGYRTDIPAVLADLDVFLITSKTEGLGTSILDAFACKVPVVATDAGGIRELVENEKTGLLCQVKNPDQIADSVLKLLNDKSLVEKLKENAFQKVQHFSKTSTAKETLKYYEEVWS
jgi:glycosyltransferase involved in cell wall biosynthesis